MKKQYAILIYMGTVIVPFLLFQINTSAQSLKTNSADIDKLLLGEMKKEQIPALSFAVVKNGKIIGSRAYGYADLELKAPATVNTKFATGSIGKIFTASAIMLLVQQGKLDIEHAISRYLSNIPEKWKPITIKQLLSHTSGIKDYAGESEGYGSVKIDRKQEYTDSAAIQLFAAAPLNFEPGEAYAYSNTAYMLLGIIIKKASGMSRGEYLKKYFFDPIGMNNTEEITVTKLITNRASGYYSRDSIVYNGQFVGNYFAATGEMGLVTTAEDMAKFDIAIHAGKVLDPGTIARMQTASKLNNGGNNLSFLGSSYGLGWELKQFYGQPLVGHFGSYINGYSSAYFRFPGKDLSVSIFNNLNNAELEKLLFWIAAYYDPSLASPLFHEAQTNAVELNAYIKRFVYAENTAADDSLFMTAALRLSVNPVTKPFLKDGASHITGFKLAGITDIAGKGKTINASVITTIYHYKISFGNEVHSLSFYLDKNYKVAHFEADE